MSRKILECGRNQRMKHLVNDSSIVCSDSFCLIFIILYDKN